MAGAALAILVFARAHGLTFLAVADRIVVPAAIFLGIGRIGNFLEGGAPVRPVSEAPGGGGRKGRAICGQGDSKSASLQQPLQGCCGGAPHSVPLMSHCGVMPISRCCSFSTKISSLVATSGWQPQIWLAQQLHPASSST
jgi:hypothetical protein